MDYSSIQKLGNDHGIFFMGCQSVMQVSTANKSNALSDHYPHDVCFIPQTEPHSLKLCLGLEIKSLKKI